MPHPSSQSGNTLIEVIAAMAIMVLGLTAMLSLAISSLAMSSMTKERVVALNLAREGIELTRAIRETNWLRDDLCWTSVTGNQCGLLAGKYIVDYTNPVLSGEPVLLGVPADNDDISACGNCSLIQPAGTSDDTKILYKSTEGTAAPIVYKRMLEIENIPEDGFGSGTEKHVISTVWWTEKGRAHTLILDTYLTNWR